MSTIEPREYLLKRGESIIVRSARREDAPYLVEIMGSAAKEGGYTVAEYDELDLTVEKQEEEIRRYTEDSGNIYLAAEADGLVVGLCECENGSRRRTAHTATFSIFILKEWRNKGVGRALLQRLIEWAAAHPVIEKLTLAVYSTNERAFELYKECGFKIEGRYLRDMKMADGTYVDSILMYEFVK